MSGPIGLVDCSFEGSTQSSFFLMYLLMSFEGNNFYRILFTGNMSFTESCLKALCDPDIVNLLW